MQESWESLLARLALGQSIPSALPLSIRSARHCLSLSSIPDPSYRGLSRLQSVRRCKVVAREVALRSAVRPICGDRRSRLRGGGIATLAEAPRVVEEGIRPLTVTGARASSPLRPVGGTAPRSLALAQPCALVRVEPPVGTNRRPAAYKVHGPPYAAVLAVRPGWRRPPHPAARTRTCTNGTKTETTPGPRAAKTVQGLVSAALPHRRVSTPQRWYGTADSGVSPPRVPQGSAAGAARASPPNLPIPTPAARQRVTMARPWGLWKRRRQRRKLRYRHGPAAAPAMRRVEASRLRRTTDALRT